MEYQGVVVQLPSVYATGVQGTPPLKLWCADLLLCLLLCTVPCLGCTFVYFSAPCCAYMHLCVLKCTTAY